MQRHFAIMSSSCTSIYFASVATIALITLTPTSAHEVTFVNGCKEEILLGILGRVGAEQPRAAGGIFPPGETHTIEFPNTWTGRFWGRTGCDSEGQDCETGRCIPSGNNCQEPEMDLPGTYAEISFDTDSFNGVDFYEINLADGYNVPMTISPTPGTFSFRTNDQFDCGEAGCSSDLNDSCPPELRQYGRTGNVVACRSPCEAFDTDEICCRNEFGTSDTCLPSNYSQTFSEACPRAYSYAYDDGRGSFTCLGNEPGASNYEVTFCPIRNTAVALTTNNGMHGTVTDCGCPDQCTPDHLDQDANAFGFFTCRERINYLMSTSQFTEVEACADAANLFPATCGMGCGPCAGSDEGVQQGITSQGGEANTDNGSQGEGDTNGNGEDNSGQSTAGDLHQECHDIYIGATFGDDCTPVDGACPSSCGEFLSRLHTACEGGTVADGEPYIPAINLLSLPLMTDYGVCEEVLQDFILSEERTFDCTDYAYISASSVSCLQNETECSDYCMGIIDRVYDSCTADDTSIGFREGMTVQELEVDLAKYRNSDCNAYANSKVFQGDGSNTNDLGENNNSEVVQDDSVLETGGEIDGPNEGPDNGQGNNSQVEDQGNMPEEATNGGEMNGANEGEIDEAENGEVLTQADNQGNGEVNNQGHGGEMCGCSSCTASVLDGMADTFTCRERIQWVKDGGASEFDACVLVSKEFPDSCPGCDPVSCHAQPMECGCASCSSEVLDRIANGYSCRARIKWLKDTKGATEVDACALVASEFPTICGQGCDPYACTEK